MFLPQQIAKVANFFTQGLVTHVKLYNFVFTQPQAHTEHEASLQVILQLSKSPPCETDMPVIQAFVAITSAVDPTS